MTLALAGIVGWRFWRAGIDGNGGAWLGTPFESALVAHDVIVLDSPEVPPAECWISAHQAPARDCMCGHRIVEDLATLVAYARRELPAAPACIDLAFVRVESIGARMRCIGSLRLGDDPPRTWRSAGLTMIGPMYLAPSLAGDAQRFRQAFRVPVVPGRGPHDRWLDQIAAAAAALDDRLARATASV